MKRIKTIYRKRPFTYAILVIIFLLIPLLFIIREKTGVISQRITQTVTCDAQTIACDLQFQENKNSACGAFKSVAVDNLLSRDDSPCKGMDRGFVEGELDKACTQGCLATTTAPTTTTIPSVTSTPSNSPSVTLPPSATTIPTATLAPSITTAPTVTHTPTTTPVPGASTVSFSLKYPGIGNGISENTVPKTPTRQVLISLQNTSGQNIKPYTAQGNFENGVYKGSFAASETGNYMFTFRMDNTRIATSAAVSLVPSTTTTVSQLTVTPGDLDQNNVLDIYDFNFLIECYGDKTCDKKQQADLQDDGVVDSKDLNILLRSFALRNN